MSAISRLHMENKKPVIFLAFANDKVDDALYLRNLPKELHGIREALHKAVQAGLCEVVERTSATIDNIFDIFQDPYYKDRIAVFHYGGHASGNQLMFETLDGGHGASHSEGLVPFFGKQKSLQLVFFNGCASQEQSLEMIEEGVPAVVGTSMAIKDEIATELATRFYNGLATGQSIEQSWQQSLDAVKTKTGTRKNKGLKLRRDKSEDFPWRMYIRQGSEIVKSWNLPLAVNNPLFGLPKLPQRYNLPEEPFRFLERYKEEHTEIFFGRGKYIRDLYNRAADQNASPIILLYGQSGVGKSSMLDSGVLPRLEQEHTVKYIRRDHTIGVLGTLRQALGLEALPDQTEYEAQETALQIHEEQFQEKIAPLASLVPKLDDELKNEVSTFLDRLRLKHEVNRSFEDEDDGGISIIVKKWKALEEASGEPFIILLDQVEEIFTKSHPDQPNELDDFMQALQNVFKNPQTKPQGKLILSYRKEYHPEIEEGCKNYQIPREEIFLKQLTKSDIQEIILGLTSTTRLQKRYRLTVEEGLPSLIADDLLEDKDSPIAPVLQILLTKMWKITEQKEVRRFTISNYVELKKEGILMDDFFEQQMEKLRVWNPDIETSGLALDVLNFHTTRLGTAGSQNLEEIRARYQHRQDVLENLISKFKELYLLTDSGLNRTGLAHDTIAPLVKEKVRQSDASGQRAYRVLSNKMPNFERKPNTFLDEDDLTLVEQGKDGMRLWTSQEEELVKISRKKREELKKRRAFWKRIGIAAIIAIIGLSIFSVNRWIEASIQTGKAKQKTIAALDAKKIAVQEKEKQKELRIAEQKAKNEAIVAKNEAIAAEKRAVIEQEKAEIAAKIAEEARKDETIAKEDAIQKEQEAQEARKVADKAREEEKKAKEKVIAAKQEVERQRDNVKKEKDKITAKVKAARALTYLQAGENIRAADTALVAYDNNRTSDGPDYSSEIYRAMNDALEKLGGKNDATINVFAAIQKTDDKSVGRDLEINKVTNELAFTLLLGRNRGQINIIKDVHDKSKQQVLRINEEVRAMRFSPKGNVLIAGTMGGKILGWRKESGEYKSYEVFDKNENSFGGNILSVTFAMNTSGNYTYMAFNTKKRFFIYQINNQGKAINKIWEKSIDHEYLVLSSKGKYLAAATPQGVQFYKLNLGTQSEQTENAPNEFLKMPKSQRVIFSKNENRIAYGNYYGLVKIYDLTTKKILIQSNEHKSPISAIKFNSTANQLVSCSNDGHGKLWNLGEKMASEDEDRVVLEGAESWIWDIDYTKNGHYVYALSKDGTIRRWHADIEHLYNELKVLTAKKKLALTKRSK